MRKWIAVLIVVVPIVEFWGYVEVAERLGVGKTIFLTLATSVIGGLMMQFEGRKVLADAKAQMNGRQIPGKTMIEGMCVFGGGILLLIPGFVTDIIGFTMVFPLTRPLYRLLLMKWIGKKIKDGSITFFRR
ncbi:MULTISPECIES: FxsA family protein [Paenibacillus]|uniref:Membrane protein FxsA n=1 Tax=Paenibacillus vini TaxID=1476024 RepID=A0ABQ4MH65_9BACL|nr:MULTISPECIES: FxsA family protein [Paenibacillus]MBQ4898550.1 FxsA family protein [Paenibacillus sp. Marseille-P2973]MDN4069990.1 FxsA family protein [Paenibacillus vini]GIP55334.1 membrane protein FxsA [Paenibacillus vini]